MKRADLGRVDSAWTVTVDADARLEQVAEALCSLADGRFGTRGAREEDGTGSTPLVLAAGVYHDDAGGGPTLLPGPVWTGLEAATPDGQDRRELDLHGGVLRRAWTTADGAALHSLRSSP
jgi:trehalose/maltose hydrolase-like predicted phosphorylase